MAYTPRKTFFPSPLSVGLASLTTLLILLALVFTQSLSNHFEEEPIEKREVDLTTKPPPPPPPEPPPPSEEKPPEEMLFIKPTLSQATEEIELKPVDIQLSLSLPQKDVGSFGMPSFGLAKGPNLGIGTFELSEVDEKPIAIYTQKPDYTDRHIKRGIFGKVSFIFTIDEHGRVTKIQTESADHHILEKLAREALKRWKFKPGKKDGQTVRVRRRQVFDFDPKG